MYTCKHTRSSCQEQSDNDFKCENYNNMMMWLIAWGQWQSNTYVFPNEIITVLLLQRHFKLWKGIKGKIYSCGYGSID